jgi:indole-3-glycerol phosphate synthase/phosphoribosylanthranilate isomerase
MAEADIAGAARRLLYGRVKICGLTRPEDVEAARALGASFGGLIFVKDSPREIDRRHSDLLAAACMEVMLPMVGVFRDDDVSRVAYLADHFDLAAVQLHGGETAEYIAELRARLPAECEIWKTIPVDSSAAPLRESLGDRPLFDTQVGSATGGTGVTFDWRRIAGRPDLARAIIAGGLSPRNIAEADRLGAWALDVNSSVEVAPGIKSADKMKLLFEALRPAARGEEAGSC